MKALILQEEYESDLVEAISTVAKKLGIDLVIPKETMPEVFAEINEVPEIVIFPSIDGSYSKNILFLVINFFLITYRDVPRLIVIGPHGWSDIDRICLPKDKILGISLKSIIGGEREIIDPAGFLGITKKYPGNYKYDEETYQRSLQLALEEFIMEKSK